MELAPAPVNGGPQRLGWGKVLLPAVFVAILGLAVMIVLRSAQLQPRYKNRSYTQWLAQLPEGILTPGGGMGMIYPVAYRSRAEAIADEERLSRSSGEALSAIDDIGDKGLPVLVRWLQSKDSKLRLALVRWAVWIPILKQHHFRSAAEKRGQALTAIIKLGRRADAIIPDLRLLACDKDPGVSATALFALHQLTNSSPSISFESSPFW